MCYTQYLTFACGQCQTKVSIVKCYKARRGKLPMCDDKKDVLVRACDQYCPNDIHKPHARCHLDHDPRAPGGWNYSKYWPQGPDWVKYEIEEALQQFSDENMDRLQAQLIRQNQELLERIKENEVAQARHEEIKKQIRAFREAKAQELAQFGQNRRNTY